MGRDMRDPNVPSDQTMTGLTLNGLYTKVLREALRKEQDLLDKARAQEPPNGPKYEYKSVEYHEQRVAQLMAKLMTRSA